jgi:CubicO group peptidase (beta-lactamase class C family)
MAKEGINSALINSLDSAITKGVYPNIHSMLIAKNNKLVHEKYWPGINRSRDTMAMMLNGKDSLHFIASITKSIVSACIGIAIKQGKIKNVNQKIFDFFPEYSKQDTGLKSALTIRHLLTMSSGIKWNEDISYNDPENSSTKMAASSNVVEYVLSQSMDFPPGKVWNYNSGGSQLLATIIEKTTGKQIDQFANEFLFKPLGIKKFKWSKYPRTAIPMASGDYN